MNQVVSAHLLPHSPGGVTPTNAGMASMNYFLGPPEKITFLLISCFLPPEDPFWMPNPPKL